MQRPELKKPGLRARVTSGMAAGRSGRGMGAGLDFGGGFGLAFFHGGLECGVVEFVLSASFWSA
jgi:hypothetical protein